MDTFSIAIEVGDAQATRYERFEALVDTGATNTIILATALRRLGVSRYRTSTFELADGNRMELEVGQTWVKVNGVREFTQVVFGPDNIDPILGAVTLEEMGLLVDPVHKRLVPVNKLLKSHARSVSKPPGIAKPAPAVDERRC